MPITPFLTDDFFDPEHVRAMGVAFVNACESLGLTDTTAELTSLVANKIIDAAKTGERDPVKLCEAARIWAARAA